MIIVLGSGWQQTQTITALAKMNFDLILVDQIESPLLKYLGYKHWKVSITDTDEIKCQIEKNQIAPSLFISPNTHTGINSVYVLSTFYETPYLTTQVIELAIDKFKLQRFLSVNGFRSTLAYGPKSELEDIDFNKTSGEFILKSRFGSGSRDVRPISFSSRPELSNWVNNYSKTIKNGYQLEYFRTGREFSIECYMDDNGDLDILAISERKMRNRISAKSIIMINDDDLYVYISGFVQKFVQKVPGFVGPVHLELIIDNDGIFVIDIGFRTGGYGVGDFLVSSILGYNLNVRWVHDLLGIEWRYTSEKNTKRFGLVYLLPDEQHIDFDSDEYVIVDELSVVPNEEEGEADSARAKILFLEVQ